MTKSVTISDPKSPLALIIGASRGLGHAMAQEYLRRGWRVVGTARQQTGTPLHALAAANKGRLDIEMVDIIEPKQVEALRERLGSRRFDLLFVNAGVSNGAKETIAEAGTDQFVRLMVTNALSPMRVIETLAECVTLTGTIGVMSSGLGSVANNVTGGWEVYRASKAALNTLMRSYAVRHPQTERPLVIMAPGWVRTDMGGPQAPFSIEESIPQVVDTLMAEAGKPGLRYLDRFGQTVPW